MKFLQQYGDKMVKRRFLGLMMLVLFGAGAMLMLPIFTEIRSAAAAESILDEKQVRDIALKDAGVLEEDLVSFESERDIDHGKLVYELDFRTTTSRYEYEIDATTGAIREKKQKARISHKPINPDDPRAANLISSVKAKEIALKHAGIAEPDVWFLKSTLFERAGSYVYEVLFIVNEKKFSYEIDAKNGDILKF